MPTYTFEAVNAGYELESGDITSFQNCYDGIGSLGVTDATGGARRVGQYTASASQYRARQVFLHWDTSSIPESETLTSCTVTLSTITGSDRDATWSVELYAYDWSTIDTADWRTTANLVALGVVGSQTADGLFGTVVITIDESAIVTTGTTRLVLATSRQRLNEDPGVDDEYWEFNDLASQEILTVKTVAFTQKFSHWPRERRANRSYIGW